MRTRLQIVDTAVSSPWDSIGVSVDIFWSMVRAARVDMPPTRQDSTAWRGVLPRYESAAKSGAPGQN